nr:hypothetical protein [Micromonospora sp. DSM 115978]
MRPHRVTTLAATICLAGGASALATAGAAAADTIGRGPGGQTLTVSKTSGVRPGERVTVTGSGYDETKGIYVAFCVDNGDGQLPTPCGGGADTSGSLGASHWISSNPPSYGEGLAVPYGPDGSFRVQLALTPKIGGIDCTTRRCAVVTRNDHTRSTDRGQDVLIPIRFAAGSAPTPPAAAPTTNRPEPARPDTGRPPTTTAPGPSGAPDAATTQPGDPTGGAPAATGTTDRPAATAEPQVTRVSNAEGLGRWWLGALAALAAAALLLFGLRVRRRRRTPSQ